MKLTRLAGALAATALLVSGCSLTTHHTTTPAPHTPAAHTPAAHTPAAHTPAAHTPAAHTPAAHTPAAHTPAARTAAIHLAPAHALADPALRWLTSPGGQAQVTLNQDVDTLAGALVIENEATTVANHLVFEADARTVAAQARTILTHTSLLPATGRAAYVTMLDDFISLASLLQPGAHYGTTAQDYTAWYTALRATNITVA